MNEALLAQIRNPKYMLVIFHLADSVSSQHHDSAYDSTDPDGDGEGGESASLTQCGSSSSLEPRNFRPPSWQGDAAFYIKPEFNRRCSEPILLHSPYLENLCSHARSHDDCSVERRNFEEQPLKKQISDDSFLLRRRGGTRQALSFPKLNKKDPLPNMAVSQAKDCSCSSLESAASNQSEGSVFTSSPVGSPPCPRRAGSTSQPPVAAKSQPDVARPITDERRRSHSMRVASKVLMRTRSLGPMSRSSLKKDTQKENSFPCETLQEDSQSEADTPVEHRHKPRPLSAVEVFKLVDSRLPCKPPPYKQAVQTMVLPPQYGSLTVQDAIELERKSRPSSGNYNFLFSNNQYPGAQDMADAVERRRPFRQRAMSESVSAGRREAVSRRCSQPMFEDLSYTKESYV